MRDWLTTFARSFYAAGQGRFILWTPVMLMIGIGIYFALPHEPDYWAGGKLLALNLWLYVMMRRSPARYFVLPLLLVALGFAAAQFRAHYVYTPLLDSELRYVAIEGPIDEIEPVEKRTKLVLADPVIENLAPDKTPNRIRVSFYNKGGQWKVGDRVKFKASLFPLPPPAQPGGYDFSRHFYFRSIGGSGYAMQPPEVVEPAIQTGFSAWVSNLRHRIGEEMREKMPGEVGAVAAAMTVGETGPITEKIKEELRGSGLAHMLSISGLHLGLMAGIVFFATRLIMALIPSLALRLPIKKIAAIPALLAASAYLLLAGAPVPAQRAFIMVALLFAGYVFDRSTVSLRTIAIAATCLLLIYPEAMMGASFQLSFAATLSIIALYEIGKSFLRRGHGIGGRIYREVVGVSAGSLFTTLATAPFILYNFNRLATFSILSNIVVIPLATLAIMPGIVLVLLLWPLGLQEAGYWLVGFGTDIMIRMSHWVNSLPYSSPRLPALTDWGVVVSAFGLFLLCLMRGRWRLAGIPFMLIGLSTMALHVSPDLMVSRDGRQVMLRLEGERYVMLKGLDKGFTAQSWLRAQGQEHALSAKDAGIECSKELCDVTMHGKRILLVKAKWDSETSKQACIEKSDILIGWQYFHRERCPGANLIIGRDELEHHGAHEFYFTLTGTRIQRAQEEAPTRIWQPKADYDNEEDDD